VYIVSGYFNYKKAIKNYCNYSYLGGILFI
jgi:hypothetical protein